MEKTIISRLVVILFTATITATNISTIAQPKNDRLNSLRCQYSYCICSQYCNMKDSKLFPIGKIFSEYFTKKDSGYILPNYNIFSKEFGCPAKVIPAQGDCYELLTRCRAQCDSLMRQTYIILSADSAYNVIVQQIINGNIDSSDRIIRLMEAELKIRNATSTEYSYNKTTKNSIPTKPRSLDPSPSGSKTSFGKPIVPHSQWYQPQLRYSTKQITIRTYYIDDCVNSLLQANLASLRVILDDHIRRGVPIDISWIPEETLAEIDATKPVRQLKKQIKTLEKQVQQP